MAAFPSFVVENVPRFKEMCKERGLPFLESSSIRCFIFLERTKELLSVSAEYVAGQLEQGSL